MAPDWLAPDWVAPGRGRANSRATSGMLGHRAPAWPGAGQTSGQRPAAQRPVRGSRIRSDGRETTVVLIEDFVRQQASASQIPASW